MLEDGRGEHERALILYELWRLDPTSDDARSAAADIYERRLATAPSAENRRGLAALTGRELPALPPLPPIVDDQACGSGGLAMIVTALDDFVASAAAVPT